MNDHPQKAKLKEPRLEGWFSRWDADGYTLEQHADGEVLAVCIPPNCFPREKDGAIDGEAVRSLARQAILSGTYLVPSRAAIRSTIWSILEDELDRDLALDLNNPIDSVKFQRLVDSLTQAARAAK